MSVSHTIGLHETQSQIQGADVVKFLMAFCVVAIHVQVSWQDFPSWFSLLTSYAVPYFFIVSGFLLMRKISTCVDKNEASAIFLARGRQVMNLFGKWIVIYIPLTIAMSIYRDVPFLKMLLDNCVWLLIKGEIAYAWPLWFLYSMSIALFIMSWAIFSKKRLMMAIMLFSICEVGKFYLDNIDSSTCPKIAAIAVNLLPLRVLGGGTYMTAGALIYKIVKSDKNNAKSSVIMSAIVLALLSIILYICHLPFSALCGGVSVFLIALSLPIANSQRLCIAMRKQSMWIYYIHMYFLSAIYVAMEVMQIQPSIWCVWFVSSICVWVAANFLTRLQSRSKFGYLRTLIS